MDNPGNMSQVQEFIQNDKQSQIMKKATESSWSNRQARSPTRAKNSAPRASASRESIAPTSIHASVSIKSVPQLRAGVLLVGRGLSAIARRKTALSGLFVRVLSSGSAMQQGAPEIVDFDWQRFFAHLEQSLHAAKVG